MTPGRPCQLCGSPVEEILDLGPQPVLNRFPRSAGEDEYTHPFVLAACPRCGLVQLPRPIPAEELRPRVDWVSYREPVGHLDGLADRVAALPGLTPDARIAGLTEHDDALLARLRDRGFANTVRLDWREALGVAAPNAATETLQAALAADGGRRLAAGEGRASLLVARSLVEHSHDLRRLLAALRELVEPGGHLVVEAPDSEPAFERGELGFLWEEHVLYFTAATLAASLAASGFAPLSVDRPPAIGELVAIARRDPPAGSTPAAPDDAGRRRAEAFAAAVPDARRRWRALLEDRANRPAALFGAGHAGAMFLNALGLGDLIGCVIEDHPTKQGLFFPGSRLPIVPSSTLMSDDVNLCLLALSPEAEAKVVPKFEAFTAAGGRFASIYSQSARYALAGDGAPR